MFWGQNIVFSDTRTALKLLAILAGERNYLYISIFAFEICIPNPENQLQNKASLLANDRKDEISYSNNQRFSAVKELSLLTMGYLLGL